MNKWNKESIRWKYEEMVDKQEVHKTELIYCRLYVLRDPTGPIRKQ